ncbi:patatin-like phospholipase-domain-containing protein [Macrophomina phaseolina]|uniref:Patatin-like phospholipase-domain-containing protein n=1 Tax=Macrophomina phaseolina TaxID=35725 RepID=A0ABQ8GV66_9PEZI|nr:patatin-like phospholipase-domain-containing protein [Macrophomina phaseolina]
MRSPPLEGSKSNPNAPLRLLSLDGGGVRGLSSLMVLKDLMDSIAAQEKRLKKRPLNSKEKLKPCDYFDLIGGTSTGGIIAVLLGRLRLDVETCIGIYTKLAQDIFKKDRSISILGVKLPTSSTRFSGTALEAAIKQALVDLGYKEDELMWDDSLFEEVVEPLNIEGESIWADQPTPPRLTESPEESFSVPKELEESQTNTVEESRATLWQSYNSKMSQDSDASSIISKDGITRKNTFRIHPRNSVHRRAGQKGCRTFVVTTLKSALGLPQILSTYNPNDRQTKIWQALRATSAAPTFFEEMTFGTPRMTYLDGGVGFNNPCAEVSHAAKEIWEGRSIGVIVSVGTGLQTIPSVKKVASWLPFGLGTDIALASALASMATGTARVDNEMHRMYYGTPTRYTRFDVESGLADVSLEQWMKEDEMAALTEQYMRDPHQAIRARKLSDLICKLSALPPKFEIAALAFRVGVAGRGLVDGSFASEELDFKTGFPLGYRPSLGEVQMLGEGRDTSPSGKAGIAVDVRTGRSQKVLPVALDLDGDGRREESAVLTCRAAENVCLRVLRTGIPPGKYRVKFIVCFFEPKAPEAAARVPEEGAVDVTPPTELVFSVGRPFDVKTFGSRYVDVKITPDIVPVLLHPDAVRVRVGKTRYAEKKGKGWIEIVGDVLVDVGLDGALGLMVTKRYEEGVVVGGWSFGGVRLEPVFDE